MSNRITPGQRSVILSIEAKLNKKFEGSTKRQAKKFINKNWDELMTTKEKQSYFTPTTKQMILVERLIKQGYGPFEGKTKKEASIFIERGLEYVREEESYYTHQDYRGEI